MTAVTKPIAKTWGANRNEGTGIPSRALNPGLIQFTEVEILSAAIKTLNASPVTLVPAPGAGKVVEFLSAVLILDYGSAAYVGNGVVSVRETNAAGTALSEDIPLASLLGKSADTIVKVDAVDADDGTALLANKAIVLSAATGETATGDGVLRVKCSFRVYETGL